MALRFRLSNGGVIKVDPTVQERWNPFIQTNRDSSEAGGVMLGRLILDSKDIVIDKVSIPMIGDKRSRHSFARGAKMHQRIVEKEWARSKGTCNYLGEWHTHPESYPSPSSTDLSDWKRKLKEDVYSTRYLYFVIIGTRETYMWEGDRRSLKIKKLENI